MRHAEDCPVVLVHGYLDTARLFRKMARHLAASGREVHCLDLIPSNAARGLEELAHQVNEYVRTHFAVGQKIDLIGFSMGGLVSRYYLQRLGGIERVRRFITIGSPHRGSYTALLGRGKGARQMRPGSTFLQDLNGDFEQLERAGFTSIWTRFDLMIIPASSSILPVGESIHVGVVAHQLMVRDGRVLRIVDSILMGAVRRQAQ